jgi:hypothetical protein
MAPNVVTDQARCVIGGSNRVGVRRGHRIGVEKLGARPTATARVGTVAPTALRSP